MRDVEKRQQQLRQKVAMLIREAREDLGWTQRQLAEASGRKQSVISRLESGKANAELQTLTDVFFAMGRRLNFQFKPLRARVRHGSQEEAPR